MSLQHYNTHNSIAENGVQSGIIEPSELYKILQDNALNNIKVLDGSFALPNSGENLNLNYYKKRIHNALFFNIKDIADQNSDLPHMLPSAEHFSSVISRLGISNNDTIIVYGQSGILMGPARVWWTFRVFGHKNICVLNGGLPAWIKENLPVNTEKAITMQPRFFEAKPNPALVKNIQDIQEAQKTNTLILDARSEGRFNGTTEEPRPGMHKGHIPGSVNLPCVNLVNSKTGKLKNTNELKTIFENVGYKNSMPVIATCGSGITACAIALAFFHIGNKKIAIYDGSWSEWGQKSMNNPVQNKNKT